MERDDDNDKYLDSVPLVEHRPLSEPLEDTAAVRAPRKWDFFVMTVPFFGLQLAWTVQQVYGIPYLSSLGIPNTQMPIFVMSGPLAGLIGPPIVAALSEKCDGRWGKRRPFIFIGGVGTIACFLVLGAAEAMAARLHRSIIGSTSSEEIKTTSHVIAGLSIYVLNFSIQPLSIGLRASVVDCFGPLYQPSAMLWVSCFSSLGSVFVALVGLWYSPAFWDLSVVVISITALLLGVVAFTNTARLGQQPHAGRENDGSIGPVSLYDHVCRLTKKARHLPPVTRQTCRIQLMSWFAWFLVLNYTSAFTSSVYEVTNIPDTDIEASSKLPSKSASAISRVALLFHMASLTTIVFVSIIWQRSGHRSRFARAQSRAEAHDDNMAHRDNIKLAHTRNTLMGLIWKPSLAFLAASLAAVCLIVSAAIRPFSSTITSTVSLLLGGNGILFALSNWVPYALIACEASAQARSRRLAMEESDLSTDEDDMPMLSADDEDGDHDNSDFHDDVPLLLAVHNVAITVPQIVASVVSWVLMEFLSIFGFEQDVVWIFAMSIPPALWAILL